ncbi:hypothetical protein KEM52_003812, partial [Ascosphaera acerosa]
SSTTTTAPGHTKHVRSVAPVPRVDYEPIYLKLKAAVGSSHLAEYKEAISLFLLGYMNQREFSARIDPLLRANPKTVRLHNHFICAIISNLARDLPDHGVAAWVSADDKPSAASKPLTGDAAERRLKTEVMQLQPKERRRLKAVPKLGANKVDRIPEPSPADIDAELQAKQLRLFELSAAGLSQKKLDHEISNRYVQPLASELRELPDADTIRGRMVPICYEESLLDGPAPPCAAYMAIATENYIKDFLSSVFSRTRLNGPLNTTNGAMTRSYRTELEKEDLAFTKGALAKHESGLLPVEARAAAARRALDVSDLKLALGVGGGVLGH